MSEIAINVSGNKIAIFELDDPEELVRIQHGGTCGIPRWKYVEQYVNIIMNVLPSIEKICKDANGVVWAEENEDEEDDTIYKMYLGLDPMPWAQSYTIQIGDR